MKSFDDPYLSIAHRGASAYAPENTMAAFRKAVELGADGIELDVQLSKDGQVFVMHDSRLERTTNGRGRTGVKTLDELKALDAGSWFSGEFKNEPIPTLKEVFEYATGKLLVDVELKKAKDRLELVQAVHKLVDEFDMWNDCLITSFDKKTIEAVVACMPEIQCGLLTDKNSNNIFKGDWAFCVVRGDVLNQDLIYSANERGKQLVVWTVDEEADMRYLLELGISRIITNYPDRAQKVLMRVEKS